MSPPRRSIRCSSSLPARSAQVPPPSGAPCDDHARRTRAVRRGRRQDGRQRSQLHAARRRQDGRRRSQRRREDQPVEGARRRGSAAARHRHPHGCDRLPAAGPAPASGRRSRHRAGAHPRRARPGGSGAPAREGTHPARGVARGHARRAVRSSRGGVPGARRLRGRVRGANADRRPRVGERPPGAPGACAVRRRAPTSGARADPVRRERPADAGRADEPPGRGREALADEVPGVVPRRADRGQPRPEAPRRVDHPDPARRPRSGRRVPRDVLAVPEGALGGRDPASLARGTAGAGDQAAQDAGGFDARPDGQARAEGQDAGHARREADGEEGRGSGARADA